MHEYDDNEMLKWIECMDKWNASSCTITPLKYTIEQWWFAFSWKSFLCVMEVKCIGWRGWKWSFKDHRRTWSSKWIYTCFSHIRSKVIYNRFINVKNRIWFCATEDMCVVCVCVRWEERRETQDRQDIWEKWKYSRRYILQRRLTNVL